MAYAGPKLDKPKSLTSFLMGPFKMILDRGRFKQKENRGSQSEKKSFQDLGNYYKKLKGL